MGRRSDERDSVRSRGSGCRWVDERPDRWAGVPLGVSKTNGRKGEGSFSEFRSTTSSHATYPYLARATSASR